MRLAVRTAEKLLDNDANILLVGESGVGKDYLAEAIHACSRRARAPFVRIDCASLPPELFESELFGFERGAFTDAHARKAGKIELAQRGTVYFDEIGSLSTPLQAKLLRMIQEKRFSRLGGTAMIDVDVRIISSSNVDVEDLLARGALRQDLYYRLNVVSILLPPLRERREDIPILARAFLRDSAKRFRKKLEGFSPDAFELIDRYSWPGNLRELKNVIDRAAILESSPVVTPESLPTSTLAAPESFISAASARGWTLDELEKHYIEEVLRQTEFNFSRAAQILGINRKTLLEKRKRFGLI